MATTLKRIPARASETLQAVIRTAGPVSAATRALLWLGTDAAGQPIPPAGRREIAALLAEEDLAPAVLAALQRLYDRLGGVTAGVVASDTPIALAALRPSAATDVPGDADDDPFGDVGVVFEG